MSGAMVYVVLVNNVVLVDWDGHAKVGLWDSGQMAFI